MAQVNLPDGRQINFPDHFTDDMIRDRVRGLLGRTDPGPQRPPAAPATDTTGMFGVDPPPHNFSQTAFGEPLRPTFEAAGGTFGSILGGAAGTIAGRGNPAWGTSGAAIGGGIGTAAGSVAYDAYRDVRRLFADDPSIVPSAGTRLEEAAKSGVMDTAVSTGVAGIPAVARGLQAGGRKVLGIKPESIELAREAERRGIDLGAADVVDEHSAPRAWINVFGRMPWFGGPARLNRDVKIDQWIKHRDGYFGVFSPPEQFSDVSRAVAEGGNKAYDAFRTEASRLYGIAKQEAEAAGRVFDTDIIVDAATQRLSELRRGEIKLLPIRDPKTGQLASSGKLGQAHAEVSDLLAKMKLLPPKVDANQLDALDTQIERTMKKLAIEYGHEFKELNGVRHAGEITLRLAAPNEPAAAALKAADDFFERGIKTFQTPTAQKFGRVTKNVFNVGLEKAGNLNEDELLRVAVNARSPDAIDDLTKLTGPDVMKRVARQFIDNAYQKARGTVETPVASSSIRTAAPYRGERPGDVVFNVSKFAQNLGLDRPNSNEYAVTKKMLQTAGVDINDLHRFVEVTKSVIGNEIPDASTFVARRGALAGVRSIIGAVAPGAAFETAVPGGGGIGLSGAMLGVLSARYMTNLMTDPVHLKRLINAYQPGVSEQTRNMTLARMLRQFAATDEELKQALEAEQ